MNVATRKYTIFKVDLLSRPPKNRKFLKFSPPFSFCDTLELQIFLEKMRTTFLLKKRKKRKESKWIIYFNYPREHLICRDLYRFQRSSTVKMYETIISRCPNANVYNKSSRWVLIVTGIYYTMAGCYFCWKIT